MQTPSAVTPELNLLFPWPEDQPSPVWRWSIATSAAFHVVLFIAGLQLQHIIRRPDRNVIVRRSVTPLYLPPELLTQRTPNKHEASKSFDLSSLLSSQQAQRRVVAPPKASVRKLELPKQTANVPQKKFVPQITAEPPKETAANQQLPAGLPDGIIAPVPAAPPSSNTTPAAGSLNAQAQNQHRISVPKNSVEDVLHQIAQGNSNSTTAVVSDEGTDTHVAAAPGQQALTARLNSALELKTDPQGADFKPYLREILTIVRRNWFSVLPASARAGILRGTTTLQFVVNKDGSIPKIVVSDPSGAAPLDRAAIAGLSMSNPLPPLPADFKGGLIKLQFSFNYNISR